MSTITTIDIPRSFYRVARNSFRLMPRRKAFQSSFVPDIVLSGHPDYMQWTADIEFVPMVRDGDASWQALEAFFDNVASQDTAFTLYDSAKELPLGAGGGFDPSGSEVLVEDADESEHSFEGGLYEGATSCLVKTAAERYANSIVVTDLPVSSVVMKAGDHFSLGGNLYKVKGDVVSDANGDARFDFLWRLHKPALANDIVTLRRPTGRFVMIDTESGAVNRLPANIGDGMMLKAVELPYTS